jgi:hypothetical protein
MVLIATEQKSLAEYSKVAYGSKRAVLQMMMIYLPLLICLWMCNVLFNINL